MAKFDAPKSKLIIEKSLFDHPKSRHEQNVKEHHFNYAVDLFLPGCDKLPSDLQDVCPDGDTYWLVKQLPLLELVQLDFIQKFLRQGNCYALSSGKIDTENVVALLPTGELILSVTKDTYEELGLVGRPSKFDQRRKPTRYVVEISLTSDSFRKGKAGYDRVQWCFKDRLHLTFDLIVAWKANRDSEMKLDSYWSNYTCTKVDVKKQTILKTNQQEQVTVPLIDSCHLSSRRGQSKNGRGQENLLGMDGKSLNGMGDDSNEEKWCEAKEFFEWLGSTSCGVVCKGEADHFVSTYTCPEPTQKVAGALCYRWTGMITSERINKMLKCLRNHITTNPSVKWGAITVHGFADSPVSWGKREHGYHTCGDNLYTFVVFPEDKGRYWYITAIGACDDIS